MIVVIQFPQFLGVSRSRLSEVIVRKFLRAMFLVLALILSSSPGFPWGGEGHQVIGLIAEKYMTTAALAKAGGLLDGSAIDAVASWADESRCPQVHARIGGVLGWLCVAGAVLAVALPRRARRRTGMKAVNF
jgi:hypothetical protein